LNEESDKNVGIDGRHGFFISMGSYLECLFFCHLES
jgi:hypothetical protein